MEKSPGYTTEAMIEAPRRTPFVPNRIGTLALYTVSTYSFETGKTTSEGRVHDLSVAYGASEQLWEDDNEDEDAHDAVWIPGTDTQIMYLKSKDKGATEVRIADGADVKKEHETIEVIDAPISNLKIKALDDGSIVFAVVGHVTTDGKLYNSKAAEKKKCTGRVFDTNTIRFWNRLFEEYRYTIWYTKLIKDGEGGKWQLASELNCLVNLPHIEAPLGMYEVSEPPTNFTFASHGVAFSARNIKQGRHVFAETSLWYVPIADYTKPPTSELRQVQLGDRVGLSENVRFTPDGEKISWLFHNNQDWFNPRIMMCALEDLDAFDVFEQVLGITDEDDSDCPSAFEFTDRADELIIQTQRHARGILSFLKLEYGATPRAITKTGTVSAVYPLVEDKWDKFVITSTSFVDSGLVQIADRSNPEQMGRDGVSLKTMSSATKHGARFNLDWDEMVEEFWFEGADGKLIHSWLIKPMGFDEKKEYPWILRPHGGPVAASTDSWMLPFNAALYAEQGYVVVLPNISGSTGFGKDFNRRVDGDWAGKCFVDLLNLLDQLDQRPYLDKSKAIIAGGSYGGYLVSWFFGEEVIKRFCGAIWHSGIFSVPNFIIQSDLLDPENSFQGPPHIWLNEHNLTKHDPSRPERLAQWKNAPPTLVSHSDKDYRVPITDGLAVMNTLLAHGVPCRFLTFSDEGHWVVKPENSRMWHETVFDWMDKCVTGTIKRGDKTW